MSKMFLAILVSIGMIASLHASESTAFKANFLSKRPYQAPLARDAGPDAKWVPAGLVMDSAIDQQQVMARFFLSKRPYAVTE